MLTANDLKLLLGSGEGYNAEFKVSVPSKVKELTEEVCAFANAAGGVLLLGVSDANEIKGVSIDNAKRSAIQNSLNDITPHLACSLSIVEVDGKSIGVIEVPSGPNKPYVGSGIGRIQDLMKGARLPEPVFQKQGIFTVILKRPLQIPRQTTQKTADRIIELLTLYPKISRTELAQALGDITEDGVKYQPANLKKQGKIERVDPDKGGFWKILKEDLTTPHSPFAIHPSVLPKYLQR